jgi:hypothetical protein
MTTNVSRVAELQVRKRLRKPFVWYREDAFGYPGEEAGRYHPWTRSPDLDSFAERQTLRDCVGVVGPASERATPEGEMFPVASRLFIRL